MFTIGGIRLNKKGLSTPKLLLTIVISLILVVTIAYTLSRLLLSSTSTVSQPGITQPGTSPQNTDTPTSPPPSTTPPASNTSEPQPNTSLPTATATTAIFDFDSGSPTLLAFQSTPFDQTSNGVTAHFISQIEPNAFSVQNKDTTFFKLSKLSGNYLYHSSSYRSQLEIKFSQPLTSITLSFATMEYHGGPTGEPSFIELTAYVDSTATNPIGSANARGTWPSGDSYPQGTLTFDSGNQPFNLVKIELPYQGVKAASAFLVDNITVKTA